MAKRSPKKPTAKRMVPTPRQVASRKKSQKIQNPGGSVSSERSITIGVGTKAKPAFINIPTIKAGKQLTERQAITEAKKSQKRFKKFGSISAAVKAASKRTDALGAAGQRLKKQRPGPRRKTGK